MKSTIVDATGQVRCPSCGATSFVEKRTGKAKWLAVPTLGIGVLAMPKRLKCSGCGTNLQRGNGTDPAADAARMRTRLDGQLAVIEAAKLEPVDAPMPPGIHPSSLRARQIRKAREEHQRRAA